MMLTKVDADKALEHLTAWEYGDLHKEVVVKFIERVRAQLPNPPTDESPQQAAERGYGAGARMDKNKAFAEQYGKESEDKKAG